VTGSPRPTRDLFGLLLLDKPIGMSSNRALQRAKRLFGAAKAGHTGSLDPLATGMLPILFGAATRLANYMLEARKVYVVTATLGSATTTGDTEGAVTEDRSHEPPPAAAQVAAAVARFIGEIEQVPPMYSALKRDGVPLYRLARAGVEVERQPRRVVIEQLTVESYAWPSLTLTVRCSKGTYVRTLVEDIARAAGTLGHVAVLRRLMVDPFDSQPMRTFEALEAAAGSGREALDGLLLPADTALAGWPAVSLAAAEVARLARGQVVAVDPAAAVGPSKVYAESGQFIAIGVVDGAGRLAPTRVFLR
jgi:tRNA pseudouridine55 synthase